MLQIVANNFDDPSTALIPPAFFRPAVGIRAVKETPYTPKVGRPTAAQKVGLKYEANFHRAATAFFGTHYRTFQTRQLSFMDAHGWRVCRPDGVYLDGDTIYLFEVKIRHTADAWWQLHRLYKPVLEQLAPGKRIICIEVCRNFDPAVHFPGTFRPILLSQLPLQEPPGVDTLIITWKP